MPLLITDYRLSQTGFSLTELMIALAISLIIMAGVIAIFINTVAVNNENMKLMRLNQELRSTMDFMVRDIRRAGYWGRAECGLASEYINDDIEKRCYSEGIGSPPTRNPFQEIVSDTTTKSYLLYSYDLNSNGKVDPDDVDDDGDGDRDDEHEWFGFRLDDYKVRSRLCDHRSTNCSDPDIINDGNWRAITERDVIKITQLQFDVANKQELLNSDSNAVTVREVIITLSGELRNDASVTRTLKETVRVQNDLIN